MKAVVLAGGKGTRLRPLTLEVPKPLIKIGGREFISYLFENIYKAGINEIGVVVGYKASVLIDFFKRNKIDVRVFFQRKRLGTAHAVSKAKKWVGNENFIVLMGDCIYSEKDISLLKRKDEMNYVLCKKRDDWKRYGVVEENGGILLKVHEKPKKFISSVVNAGAYKFTQEIFYAIKKIKRSERGEYELTDAINILAMKGKVGVVLSNEPWLELGRPEDVEKIYEFIKKRARAIR